MDVHILDDSDSPFVFEKLSHEKTLIMHHPQTLFDPFSILQGSSINFLVRWESFKCITDQIIKLQLLNLKLQ